jgi:hypothetical protein
MKIIDFFKELAGKGEQNINKLAAKQLDNHAKSQAFGRIEERFREMAADGYLDEKEISELTSKLKAEGLDTAAIQNLFAQLKGSDSSVRTEDAEGLMQLIETKLDNAHNAVRDNESETQFAIQMAVADYTGGLESASKLSKIQFDADMVAIRHIAG